MKPMRYNAMSQSSMSSFVLSSHITMRRRAQHENIFDLALRIHGSRNEHKQDSSLAHYVAGENIVDTSSLEVMSTNLRVHSPVQKRPAPQHNIRYSQILR